MARLAHEHYRRGMKPDYKRPNTLPWEALPEYYQESSRAQVAYIFHALTSRGYQLQRAAGAAMPVSIPEGEVEPLWEMEHGRWNFERLWSGWRRASEKNDDQKLSPYLVPWKELPEQIKQYDREAVLAFPRILAEGGYHLRLPEER